MASGAIGNLRGQLDSDIADAVSREYADAAASMQSIYLESAAFTGFRARTRPIRPNSRVVRVRRPYAPNRGASFRRLRLQLPATREQPLAPRQQRQAHRSDHRESDPGSDIRGAEEAVADRLDHVEERVHVRELLPG